MMVYLGPLILHRRSDGFLWDYLPYIGDLVVVYLGLLILHRGSGDGLFRTTYLT